ncbi:sugar ABC transporter permease [Paenibacillus swuensis]|uniref:Sugar ABC transporter permease n=1 Tax=Paenibacillus swuensis TaxID=1178515 RepID=A0A172TH99_9BACL|nr:carbohydrate ABC transporter permease [Paenibacillus swuensis]ANE46425.1 sugar ABC transporter permease [Paenibacillus swuensis]
MKIGRSPGDRVFHSFNVVFLTFFFLIILYPLVYIVSASFSAPSAIIAGKVWFWPVQFTLDGYKAVFNNPQLTNGFRNSLFYMIAGTAVNLIFTVMAAYPLARKNLIGRNWFMGLFVFTMIFNGGLIPTFLVIKDLGLYDSRWALILPVALSVFNMIIMRTYLQNTLPAELYEAAEMDGCNDFQFLFKIVLPLSGPILAVVGLYYAVYHWNSYFNALIYLRDQHLFPLQIVLRNILITNTVDPMMLKDFDAVMRKQGLVEVLKYSTIVVASAPMFAIYPFVQRYFVKGMMIGSVKG